VRRAINEGQSLEKALKRLNLGTCRKKVSQEKESRGTFGRAIARQFATTKIGC